MAFNAFILDILDNSKILDFFLFSQHDLIKLENQKREREKKIEFSFIDIRPIFYDYYYYSLDNMIIHLIGQICKSD